MFTSPLTRQAWLGILARSGTDALSECLQTAPPLPAYSLLRGPEVGMSMVRGRAGGGGAAFNLGEMTIVRCSIRDEAGRVGHAYAAGRDLKKVELIARLDAVLQDERLYEVYERAVLAPLARAEQDRRDTLAAKAAATDVQFLTLSVMRS